MKTWMLSASRTISFSIVFPVIVISGFSLAATRPANAAGPQVPWECSQYEGDAQTRCLNAFVELQREKIDQLTGQLQAQEGTVKRLQDQVDRQDAATADLQRKFSDRPATTFTPLPYGYSYWYPPGFGLGLYLGRPWLYGPPYAFGPYWGPHHYYRPWRHGR